MSHQILNQFSDPVVVNLLDSLDLSHEHYANFEPAFVDALEVEHPNEYLRVVRHVRDHEGELGLTQDVLAKILEDLLEAAPGLYWSSRRKDAASSDDGLSALRRHSMRAISPHLDHDPDCRLWWLGAASNLGEREVWA
jgi:hypothetical protein